MTNKRSDSKIGYFYWFFVFTALFFACTLLFIPDNTRLNQTSGIEEESIIPHFKSKMMPQKKSSERYILSKSQIREEHKFNDIIIKASFRYDIDPDLVRAVIMAESGYKVRAVSSKGALGLMQIMPKTARYLGIEDCFDPEHNINGGVRYLRELINIFDGDIRLALAAYNAGMKRVREYQGIPPFKATKKYVKKVFEYYQIYKSQNLDQNIDRA